MVGGLGHFVVEDCGVGVANFGLGSFVVENFGSDNFGEEHWVAEELLVADGKLTKKVRRGREAQGWEDNTYHWPGSTLWS